MILNTWDNTNTTGSLTVSPPEFPRQGSVTTAVEPLHFLFLENMDLRDFMQSVEPNISIQINSIRNRLDE